MAPGQGLGGGGADPTQKQVHGSNALSQYCPGLIMFDRLIVLLFCADTCMCLKHVQAGTRPAIVSPCRSINQGSCR